MFPFTLHAILTIIDLLCSATLVKEVFAHPRSSRLKPNSQGSCLSRSVRSNTPFPSKDELVVWAKLDFFFFISICNFISTSQLFYLGSAHLANYALQFRLAVLSLLSILFLELTTHPLFLGTSPQFFDVVSRFLEFRNSRRVQFDKIFCLTTFRVWCDLRGMCAPFGWVFHVHELKG